MVPKILPPDRHHIIRLNDIAAAYRKLVEVSSFPAESVYILNLGRYMAYTDCAVEQAMRRAA